MFNTSKTLIVVYKDELFANQIKKLVETNDDPSDGDVIGIRDGSVKIVSWSEKVWLGNKKAGNIDSKVLFIDKIKGTDKLIPVLDIKFDRYGVKYGWAGNQAAIFLDVNTLSDPDVYQEFLSELKELPVPEAFKNGGKENGTTEIIDASPDEMENEVPQNTAKHLKIEDLIVKAKEKVSEGKGAVEDAIEKIGFKSFVKKQMLFYGIIKLYENDLNTFMQS